MTPINDERGLVMIRERLAALSFALVMVSIAGCSGSNTSTRSAIQTPTESATASIRETVAPGTAASQTATTRPSAPAVTPQASATQPQEESPTFTSAPVPTARSGASGSIVFTYGVWKCSAFEFYIESPSSALTSVQWHTIAPNHFDPAARDRLQHDGGISPGRHTWGYAQQGWAGKGTNQLTITATNDAGDSKEETRELSC